MTKVKSMRRPGTEAIRTRIQPSKRVRNLRTGLLVMQLCSSILLPHFLQETVSGTPERKGLQQEGLVKPSWPLFERLEVCYKA